MSNTPSTMLPLGTPLPDFELPDVLTGQKLSSRALLNSGEKGLVVIFMCNHCPFVKHILDELDVMIRDYPALAWVGISANDVEAYPEDRPELMKALAISRGWSFPYLYDEAQEVAKAFEAACTPDFYLFNKKGKLVYRGQMDDSRPGNGIPVTGRDLRKAMDALLKGLPIDPNQKPSLGCNIKWKPNRAPTYFSRLSTRTH